MRAETTQRYDKYIVEVLGVDLDVYDVLHAYGVTNPALQHLIKKALMCGNRGHKTMEEDLQDIIQSSHRAWQLYLQDTYDEAPSNTGLPSKNG